MTSKNLFIKLLKEDLKRRIWSIALLSLVFFIILPVFCALSLESYSDYDEKKWVLEAIIVLMGPQHWGVFIVTIAGAIVCGISGFFSLHSRKRVDFYHSIPVKRETLFAVNYTNGLLIYFVPYIISIIMCFGVLRVNDYMNLEVFHTALTAVVINMVYYSLIYTIVIIAVMLTGNFVVSCLGTGVLLLYGPTVMLVQELYYREFFQTYYADIRLTNCMKFLSPLWIYFDVTELWVNEKSIVASLITGLAATVVLGIFAAYLYHRRPSEAAGNAIAFSKSKPIIKILLVSLLSLGGGIFLRGIVEGNYDGWFAFGLLFTMIIVYAVVEIIYNFDIRSAFHHKKQMLVCVIIIGTIAGIFRFDLFRYDTYLPDKSDIKSMSIAISGLNSELNYFVVENGETQYIMNSDYQLEHMTMTDVTAAYEMSKLGVEQVEDINEETEYDNNSYGYTVKYTLNNGKEVYRSYTLNTDQSFELMKDVFDNKEFKQTHYQINEWKPEDIGKVYLRYGSDILNDNKFGLDGKESAGLVLGSQDKKEFIETYKAELNAMSLEELKNSEPLLSLRMEVNKIDISDYYIYPSFKNTIALLNKYGFDTTLTIDAENIVRIEVVNYRPIPEETKTSTTKGVMETSSSGEKAVTYTEAEDIKEIIHLLVNSDYYHYNRSVIDVEDYIDVYVYAYNNDYDQEINYSYKLKQGAIPDFILKDIGAN